MPTPYLTGTVKFNKLTQGIYDALGDNVSPYQFYITTDTNNAYLGKIRLFDVFHLVDGFDEPYSGDIRPKSLCVKLTQGEDGAPLIEAKILQEDYTFTELVPPIMGEIVDEDNPEDRTVPTRRAVWKFVDDRLTALQEYFDALENRVVGYMERAETAAVSAEESEQAAADSADDANDSAIESESYARGGTGTRTGEDTDNSKYYMEQAKEAASQGGGSSEEARRQAEKAAQSAAEALQSEQNAKASENAAALSEQNAHGSEVDAAASAVAAAGSAADASASAVDAHASEVNASASETAASGSASEAAGSARDAATSAGEAAQSELNAAGSESNAAASETAALQSEQNAKASENAASGYASGALASEQHALASEQAALASQQQAAQSAADALDSEGKAKASETNAANSETGATNAAVSAAASAAAALQSERNAAGSAQDAAASAQGVEQYAGEAASSAAAAEQSEQDAAAQAKLSESWAKGDTGVRDGEDTNNAKYWAEQARQASPDGKADKVIGATAGDLAGLDDTGNLTDSGIPADNVALQNGSYDTLHSGTAGNLVDDRAPSTNRKFGFDTACGDISISDEGTADPTLLKGTTYVKNQLVGDSKVIKATGQGMVTDGYSVAGDIDHAYIKGRSLVKNQLVPAYVDKPGDMKTGLLEITDAVPENAGSLVIKGRAVVRNQQVPSGSMSNSFHNTGHAYYTHSATWVTGNRMINGHRYLMTAVVTGQFTSADKLELYTQIVGAGASPMYGHPLTPVDLYPDTPTFVAWRIRDNDTYDGKTFYIGVSNYDRTTPIPQDETFSYTDLHLIDLTQYFNGDDDLAKSFENWDEYVAYDPWFAEVASQNSGEVDVYTTPGVQLCGKNLQTKATSTITSAGVTFTPNSDGSIAVSGVADGGSSYTMPSVRIKPGETYTVSGIASATNIIWEYVKLMDKEGNTLWTTGGTSSSKVTIDTSLFPSADQIQFRFKRSNNGAVSGTLYPQLELGSTATAYEAFQDRGSATAPQQMTGINAAVCDTYDVVAGTFVKKTGSVDLSTLTFTHTSSGDYGYWTASVSSLGVKMPGSSEVPSMVLSGGMTSAAYSSLDGSSSSIGKAALSNGSLVINNGSTTTAPTGTMVYELADYVTTAVTPVTVTLQSGTNTLTQTNSGRRAEIALPYKGTDIELPLRSGRTYICRIGNTVSIVTDGSTQSVTGGQDMIVDLTMLYNGVASLITPIADWDKLVSDTGMYGSYTAYDEGTIVHSDQTEVKVTGKNLLNITSESTVYTGFSYNTVTPTVSFNSLGKGNLVDNSVISGTGFLQNNNDTWYLSSSGNTITTGSGSISASMSNNSIYGFGVVKKVKPGTYTFSCSLQRDTEASGYRMVVVYLDKDSYLLSHAILTLETTATLQQKTLTVPTNAEWVVVVFTHYAQSYLNISNVQLELGSTATSYEPYYSGGTATAGLLKGVPGSVYDQLDAITGKVTTRIGSYTFTGEETWSVYDSTNNEYVTYAIKDAYRVPYNAAVMSFILAGYQARGAMSATSPDMSICLNSTGHGSNSFLVRDNSVTSATNMKAKMAGKTVYYRLATYTSSTTTPQPLTQSTGNLTVLQTSGTLPVNLDIRHAVSEWDEPIVRNCKYIFRDNGVDSLVTGSTTVTYKHVVGGVNKLINLTQWFGRNREPSIDNFYKLFPTWKGADIPYDGGTILNYKGTGVRTIGFNCYNHATGTAVLLGGHQYQICGTYTAVSYVDQWGSSEEIAPDADGLFTPLNNGTLTVVGGNDTDTCVHLTWSGYKNYGQPDYEYQAYAEKGVTWDLSPWFPDGMNGYGTRQDEMTNNSLTRKWGRKVFDGTENFDVYTSGAGFYTQLSDMRIQSGGSNDGACNYLTVWTGSASQIDGPCVLLGSSNNYVYFLNITTGLDIDGSTVAWKAYLAELYAAGTPLTIIYPLATPVTSEVAPTQNFSYPVNDFGTEQSLPVNTLTLLTTDLDAEIRYSLDFTRTVQHYSEIEDDVEQLVKEKDNLARQDGNYGDKGGVFNYATQLLDPNAPPTEASYGNRTAAGDVSIADNGTADVTSLQGTTQIQNQLVHDTNMNTKSSVDGRLVLTDAVGGQLSRLEIHGGCVVHNQLVKESVEKTVNGTGRLGCEDGVAGNAKSLLMTAPRSVVMNQLIQNGDFSDGTTGWGAIQATVSVSNGVLTTSFDNLNNRVHAIPVPYVSGHVYMAKADIKTSDGVAGSAGIWMYSGNYRAKETPANTEWNTVFVLGSMSAAASINYLQIRPTKTTFSGAVTVQVKNVMLVDLTQYFNGNTTLINSITSWDDLVAYDSSFASYVTYDTGTVKGVQPTVKVNHTTDVACPVELFGVSSATDTFDAVTGLFTKRMNSYTFTGTEAFVASTLYDNCFNWVNGITDAKRHDSTVNTKGFLVGYFPTTAISNDQYHSADLRFTVNSTFNAANTISIRDSSCSTAQELLTKLTGRTLYYELATPTTSQYNPTTIPTVDIYNTALQTAGTRSCGLSLTYDGKDQTIALNPSHTYVFNDNQEDDSLITGQSSIEATGGEDQLVDITQLYNGDATKIAQIQRWASLSTRFHRYRDFQPYNPGTVEPYCPTVRVFPNEHAYGILYDPSQNTPACQWVELNNGVLSQVASFDAFSSHPCHELYRCVMSDLANRTIAYYLDDEDSDKKYNGTRNGVTSDGTASVLTGADGDVETELPIGYWDMDEDYQGTGKILWLISDAPFMGSWYPAEIHDFFYVSPDGSTPRKQYVGSYRGCICDADGNPLNTTEGALAQVTGTASTNKVRSIKGALPYVSVSLNDFTVKSGRNGGSSVNVKYHQWLFLLMAIEYGTLDNRAISYGYAGGINNAFCFWRKSGRVNAGNGTAEIRAVEGTQDMDNFQKFTVGSTTVQRDTNMDADGRYAWSVYNRTASSTRYFTSSPTPSNGDPVYTASTGTTTAGTVASYTLQSNRTIQFQYRGIENPFGEVWEFEHGIQKFHTGEMKSFRGSDNVTYTRSPANDGASSRAWTNPSSVVFWTTTGSITTSTFLYSDPDLTTATTVKYKDSPAYRYASEGYWETLATDDYTMTSQRTAANPVYTVRHNHWPLSGWDTKFDPVTFFMRKTGSPGASGRYLPDYWYNDGTTGDRVVCVGGYCSNGSYDGLGFRVLYLGLSFASVGLSGRPSA